jgi:hypothetical protein
MTFKLTNVSFMGEKKWGKTLWGAREKKSQHSSLPHVTRRGLVHAKAGATGRGTENTNLQLMVYMKSRGLGFLWGMGIWPQWFHISKDMGATQPEGLCTNQKLPEGRTCGLRPGFPVSQAQYRHSRTGYWGDAHKRFLENQKVTVSI